MGELKKHIDCHPRPDRGSEDSRFRGNDIGRGNLVSSRIGALAGAVSAAAVATLAAKETQADPPSAEIHNDKGFTGVNGSIQLSPGISDDTGTLIYHAYDPSNTTQNAMLEVDWRIESDGAGGRIFRILGAERELAESAQSIIKIPKPDGTFSVIRHSGESIIIDGVDRSDADGSCNQYINNVHLSPNPDELIIVGGPFNSAMWSRTDFNAWRVSLAESNLCATIKQHVAEADAAGQNPIQAGLINRQESTTRDEFKVPQDDLLVAQSRDEASGSGIYMMARDPAFPVSDEDGLNHLQFQEQPDTSWQLVPEDTETILGNSDAPSPTAWDVGSVLKRETAEGDESRLFVFANAESVGAMSLSHIPGTNSFDVHPIAVIRDSRPLDSDGDGIADFEDGATGRADASQLDIAGPSGVGFSDGINDARQLDCTRGGWPGVDPPLETNASGLRVCDSGLGADAGFTPDDGSFNAHLNDSVASPPDLQFIPAENAIELTEGQELLIQHTCAAQVATCAELPEVRCPPGNSCEIDILDTTSPTGVPGTVTVTHDPQDPFADPVVQEFTEPSSTDIPVSGEGGTVISSSGTTLFVRVGTENQCIPVCPSTPECSWDCPVEPADTDSDGVPDATDNCVTVANPGQENTYGDARGDACEDPPPPDTDADGVPDATDNCVTVANPGQENTYGDLRGDACEDPPPPDTDADGVPDSTDNCIDVANFDQLNTYGDSRGDACEDPPLPTDTDADGVPDATDNCVYVANPGQEDWNSNGVGDACGDPPPPPDNDGDGVWNGADNCIDAANPDQLDSDGNGLGDACDVPPPVDTDADGVPDETDNCIDIANPDQLNTYGDARGDACEDPPPVDTDADGVPDIRDNCITVPNPGQENTYGTALGDACEDPPVGDDDTGDDDGTEDDDTGDDDNDTAEPDTDADGVPDISDNCVTIPNPGQENTYGTLLGDACEDPLADDDTTPADDDTTAADDDIEPVDDDTTQTDDDSGDDDDTGHGDDDTGHEEGGCHCSVQQPNGHHETAPISLDGGLIMMSIVLARAVGAVMGWRKTRRQLKEYV